MSKPTRHLKWVTIDFDQTIALHDGYPNFNPIEPMVGAKEALERIWASGHKIHIYTSRPWGFYNVIEDWLVDNEIPFDQIHCGKVLSKLHIDDRAFRFNDWNDEIDDIMEILE